MELESQFESAVELSKKLAYKPSNERLLQLYGLYKQATAGDCTADVKNPFDLVARAKHDAWAKLKGTDPLKAKMDYVELVQYLSNKPKQTVLS
ncbi:MAG: acyl-CoA-binding protein [Bacteroidia bacterium]|nr:acyl-CoA-binding protein [Bacteroidia bacterium]